MRQFGLAVLCAVSLSMADKLIDDHSDGTNQNEFEYYWYYTDDNFLQGEEDRPQGAPMSQPSVIDVPSADYARRYPIYPELVTDTSDNYLIKFYSFTLDQENENKFATMPFTFGSQWKTSVGVAQPYVALNTMLAPNGSSVDLSNTVGFTFKIRSRKNDSLNVDFKIKTLDIFNYSHVTNPPGDAYSYYRKTVAITNEWSEIFVSLAEITQPEGAKKFEPMDVSHVFGLEWEVGQSLNPDVTGDTLDIDDIYIVEGRPAPPTPLVPQNGKIDVSVPTSFYWSNTSASRSFRFQLFSTFPQNHLILDTNLLTTSFQIDSLEKNSTYFWRIRSYDFLDSSDYSDTSFFTTTIEPSAPVLVSPSNNALKIAINSVLKWNTVSNATVYRIKLMHDSLGTDMIIDTVSPNVTLNVYGLEKNSRYYWQVFAKNIFGETASEVWSFITAEREPDPVSLAGPTDGDTVRQSTVDLVWFKSPQNAHLYYIEISTKEDMSGSAMDSVTDTSKTFQVSGSFDTYKYYWRVRAVNGAGLGEWSEVQSFYVKVPGSAVSTVNLHSNNLRFFSVNNTIRYSLPAAGFVTIKLFDLNGRTVKTLVNAHQNAGTFSHSLNGMAKGTYLLRTRAGTYSHQQIIVIK